MVLDDNYLISDDPADVDIDAVWAFMNDVTWGRWRSREVLDGQVRDSWRVVTIRDAQSRATVAFARAFSDGVSLAYLADVYVAPSHRGRRLGEALIAEMVQQGPGKNFKWMLHTHDTHGLYAKFGFVAPGPSCLERPSPLAPPAS